MKPVNAKIPAKKKAGIVAMVALPKSFSSGMRRKTRNQFVDRTGLFSGVLEGAKRKSKKAKGF